MKFLESNILLIILHPNEHFKPCYLSKTVSQMVSTEYLLQHLNRQEKL